jgi:hypothetical protein
VITAKIRLNTKSENGAGGATLSFGPDYQDGRNKEWATATPALSLSMTVVGDVADRFTEGDAYTLTFSPSD